MSGLGPTVGPPPDRQVMTNGVNIPDLLDMQTRRFGSTGAVTGVGQAPGDPDEWPVYWLLRRYHTFLPVATVASIVEPIRAKVASTQDLTLLTTQEREMVRVLNNLYNTDYDQTGIVVTN